jgi:hypothetical protein
MNFPTEHPALCVVLGSGGRSSHPPAVAGRREIGIPTGRSGSGFGLVLQESLVVQRVQDGDDHGSDLVDVAQ